MSIQIREKIELNETQRKIIALLSENPKISAKAIAEEIGIAPRSVETNITLLKKVKMIDRVGSPRGGHWVVNQSKQDEDTQERKKNG